MTKNKRYTLNREGIDDLDEYGLESPISLGEDVLTFGEIIDKLNEQEETIKRLKEIREEQIQTILKQKRKIKELEQELQNLQTFKKVLEFAEKDMEERADWQAYCEKEFEGL